MTEPSTFIAAAVAFAACLALVPIGKQFATRIGLVDKPDKKRKLHEKAIPLCGGISIAVALCIAVPVTGLIALLTAGDATWFVWQNYAGVLVSGSFLLGIGILDDRFGMRGRTKLAGQMLAICLFLLFGKGSYEIEFLGMHLPMWMSMGIVCVWLLGSINAVNLIDGADGMASTVGVIASTALAVMAFASNKSAESVLAAAMAGSILAFLIYNFPPASAFLGDAGSMMIGFLIGATAINASSKEAASIMMVAPAAVIIIPVFDSFVAILRRRLTGRSIYQVDRGHIHHTLMANGYSPRQMLLLVASLSLISAIGGTVSTMWHNDFPAMVSVTVVVGFLVLGRVFGFAEFVLLKNKLFSFGSSFLTTPEGITQRAQQQTIRLQGSRNWDLLWHSITDFAEEHLLAQVRLDLNLPWLHEGYHATWQRPVSFEKHECWKTSLPMTADGRTFGRLEVVGPLCHASVYVQLSLLSELLESMEPVIARLANEDIKVTNAETAAPARPNTSEEFRQPVMSSNERIEKVSEPVGSNI